MRDVDKVNSAVLHRRSFVEGGELIYRSMQYARERG